MIQNKLAGLFVEPRKVKQVYYTLQNFQKCLPGVPLFFYCGKGLTGYFLERFCDSSLQINCTLINIVELDCNNLTYETYCDLLKSKTLWESIPYDFVLTIQTDGCLCENSPYKIEDFFQYDYVGGYAKQNWWWKETNGLHHMNDYQCFNGGFSLRNRNACLDVINSFPPQPSEKFTNGLKFEQFGEDTYFVVGLLKLKKYKVGLDFFATFFCTHTSFSYPTFCIHKAAHYCSKSELDDCILYCKDYQKFIKLENL